MFIIKHPNNVYQEQIHQRIARTRLYAKRKKKREIFDSLYKENVIILLQNKAKFIILLSYTTSFFDQG